jgi:hypothetical protein
MVDDATLNLTGPGEAVAPIHPGTAECEPLWYRMDAGALMRQITYCVMLVAIWLCSNWLDGDVSFVSGPAWRLLGPNKVQAPSSVVECEAP